MVARVSDRKEPLPVSGHSRGSGAVRGATCGRLRCLAKLSRVVGRSERPAGDPQLDVPRRRSGRAKTQAAGDRVYRYVDFQIIEMFLMGAARLSKFRGES